MPGRECSIETKDGRKVLLELLRRNTQLRALVLGFAAGQLGIQIGWIALVWWIVNSAHSPALLGVLFVAFQVPMIFSAPLAGALIDRLDAKRVAVFSCLVGTLALAAIATLASVGDLTLPVLFGLLVILSLTLPATLTYRRTLLGQIVQPEQLPAAYALFSMGTEASILIGPAAGGFIVGGFSTGAALSAFALGYALYLVAIATSRYARKEEPPAGKLDVLAGTREIAHRPIVLAVTLLTFFFYTAYGPLEVALPMLARTVFHTNAAGYGLMWTAYAIGSVCGLLLLRARYERFPRTSMLCAIAVMWGVLAGAIAFAHSIGIAMAVLLVAGLLWSPYSALESSFMQVQVPERVQGAVFSMQSSFLYTLAVPLGAMLGGWALAHTNPQAVIFASGAACVAAGLVGYLVITPLRRMARTPEPRIPMP